jgi:hypothetical protein
MNFTMDLPGSSQETVFAGGPRKLLGNAVLARALYGHYTNLTRFYIVLIRHGTGF